MAESKKRKKVEQRRIARQQADERRKKVDPPKGSPKWWVPVPGLPFEMLTVRYWPAQS